MRIATRRVLWIVTAIAVPAIAAVPGVSDSEAPVDQRDSQPSTLAGDAAALGRQRNKGAVQAAGHPFHPNVKVTVTQAHLIVESDGIPTHETGQFPNRSNPNRIVKQRYRFLIPRDPKIAERPTPLPMGPIGVAINGVPLYNPYNAHGKNAVEGPFAEVFDSCCGHPDPMGRYHYHKYPVCIHNPFEAKDKPGEHSKIIGYAFDGFAVYGPMDEGGKPPKDLDECNGHSDETRGYHYHVTAKFPYILGAYKGVVDRANFDRGPGGGGPGGPDGKGPRRGRPPKKDRP